MDAGAGKTCAALQQGKRQKRRHKLNNKQRLDTMSQIVRGILGAMAVTGTLGAAQLAMGGDLGHLHLDQALAAPAAESAGFVQNVNRAAKADRAGGIQQVQPGRTLAINLIGQSVLVRMPSEQLGDAIRSPGAVKPAVQRKLVACEPVVSVLTEVAKQLQPGRCVA